MRTFLIVCAGALALGGTAAMAQEELHPDAVAAQQNLATLDTNADGAMDAAELAAGIGQGFVRLDANGDGYVTLVESSVALTPEQFAAANANGDDGLSLEELQAQATADFAAADKDGDGKLD